MEGCNVKKIIDDVIIRKRQAVSTSKVMKNMHFLKTKLTSSRGFFSEINTYNFIEFIPNFTNAL
jgi:uncharacterized protein YaaQ